MNHPLLAILSKREVEELCRKVQLCEISWPQCYERGEPIQLEDKAEARKEREMPCSLRQQRGTCDHFQCVFPDQSGHRCLSVVDHRCVIGEDCVEQCAYSWESGRKNPQRKGDPNG